MLSPYSTEFAHNFRLGLGGNANFRVLDTNMLVYPTQNSRVRDIAQCEPKCEGFCVAVEYRRQQVEMRVSSLCDLTSLVTDEAEALGRSLLPRPKRIKPLIFPLFLIKFLTKEAVVNSLSPAGDLTVLEALDCTQSTNLGGLAKAGGVGSITGVYLSFTIVL